MGDFDPGEGISRQGGGDWEGLFEGLLPFLSPEVRKSDILRVLDLVGMAIPDLDEFLCCFTLLLTMMEGRSEGEGEGVK